MTKYPRFSSFYLVLFAGLARSVPLDVGYENRSKKTRIVGLSVGENRVIL